MIHGIEEYFLERARCRRRVSLISAVFGAVLLLMIAVLGYDPVRRKIDDRLLRRFGLAGPTKYVQRVQIEAQVGLEMPLLDIGSVVPVSMKKGGGGELAPRPARVAPPHKRTKFPGEGDASQTLVSRALSGRSRVPIFQSEDLIIDQLVRPQYPEDARDRGIEGKVSVIAHVDTLGRVIETQVMTASGEAQLDDAAEAAVRLCRFRPYLVSGAARDVYAIFRFSFRIY